MVIENKLSCILARDKSFSVHAKTRLQSTAWENDLNSVLPIAYTSFYSWLLLSLISFQYWKGKQICNCRPTVKNSESTAKIEEK